MNSFPFFTYLYAEFRQSRIPHYLNHRVWEALLLAGVLLCFFISLYRIAWLSDDIYLTLRSVWNFVHGYGMRWNVHERVQAFTHPLWFFILSALYYLTRDVYYTTIILSLFLSMTTVTFFAYAHRNHPVRTAVLLLLLMYSWAFTEYCTSGLENPLSYLVLTLFVLLYGRLQQNHASFFALCLLAALSMLNRLDTALLYAPALAYVWCGLRDRRALLLGAAALTPLMAWFVFSIVYYGFPFPNTAYAKLGGGIPRAEMIVQGLRYLQNSAVRDPLTLSLIAAAVIASLWSWKSRLLPLTTSIVLYVLYTIHIGGDFMSGRFLSLPVLLSILVLARLPLMRSLTAVTVLFCFLQVCLENTALSSRVQYRGEYGGMLNILDPYLIADERDCYFNFTGLVSTHSREHVPNRLPGLEESLSMHEQNIRAFEGSAIGMTGYANGPNVRLIDRMALGDPLLARLPAKYVVPKWRIGHLERHVPDGYEETLREGVNRIQDPKLARYYDYLCVLTQAPLFSWNRFKTILLFQWGAFDYLIDVDAYRFPQMKRLEYEALRASADQTPDLNIQMPKGGLHIALTERSHACQVSLDISGGESSLLFMDGTEILAQVPRSPASYFDWEGIRPGRQTQAVPEIVQRRGYDGIRILPTDLKKEDAVNNYVLHDFVLERGQCSR